MAKEKFITRTVPFVEGICILRGEGCYTEHPFSCPKDILEETVTIIAQDEHSALIAYEVQKEVQSSISIPLKKVLMSEFVKITKKEGE